MTGLERSIGHGWGMKNLKLLALSVALGAATIAACNSPAASVMPSDLASQAASPIASIEAAVTTALDSLDTAVAAAADGEGMTPEDETVLTDLAGDIRADVEAGDLTAAASSVDELATAVDGMSDKIAAEAAPQLQAAIDALQAALGS